MSRGSEPGARRFVDVGAQWVGPPALDLRPVSAPQHTDVPFETWGLRPAPYLRREFSVAGPAQRATLTITARGLYECWLNGARVGDHVLAPGWTDYDVRIHVQTYDVGTLLRPGPNVLAAVLTDGWYCGFVGFDRGHQARLWGEVPRLLARLDVTTEAGTTTVVTDHEWRYAQGQVRYADLLMGEMHDARAEPSGWRAPGFDDTGWTGVQTEPVHDERPLLVASPGPPLRVVHELAVRGVRRLDGDGWLVDVGQNVVGAVRLEVVGAAPGARIHLRHGEALDDDGHLYVANLRTALAHDIYVCAGTGRETFAPSSTVHGFRYVEVTGYPGELTPDRVGARVVHSDVELLGSFHCGDAELDRLHENVVWSLRGNLLDVPTDCPQRDERLGWLADAQLVAPTACFLMDLHGFLAKWTQDVVDAQGDDGAFPDVAPAAAVHGPGAPGWADAGVLVPWQAHLHHGDADVLEERYPAMQRWLDLVVEQSPGLLRRHGWSRAYGDWLHVDSPTDPTLFATAYLAASVEAMAHSAAALGRSADHDSYSRLWHDVAAAFAAELVRDDGDLVDPSQTAYAMALHLDLVPDGLRAAMGERLVDDVRRRGLTTGIHGTRFLCPALSDVGRSDVAHELVRRTDCPSWLHSVRAGATTVWERWDGWTAERGFQTSTMNSFNHYALGSVAEWMHRYAVGIAPVPELPAYRHVLVRPHPVRSWGWAEATRLVPDAGEVHVRWEYTEDGDLGLAVEVPDGVSASVHVPDGASPTGYVRHDVAAGAHRYRTSLGDGWRPGPELAVERLRSAAVRGVPLP